MRIVFYVFLLRESLAPYEIDFQPVFIGGTNKWLEFGNYTDAENWVKEQYKNGSRVMYQIQKVYKPAS